MSIYYRSVSVTAVAAFLATPALAQEVDEEPVISNEIVVTAERIRGEVDTDVPPVLELEEEEIASFGAASIADLVEQLAPQTGSGRGRGDGRPVFLLNGQRIASFRQFRRYPPEAIRKVEVLPEEVALQFGYPADQRVINFILKDNFASREVEAEYGLPTAGGTDGGEIEFSTLMINGPRRTNIGFEYNTQSLLTEDQRDIVQTTGNRPTVPGDPDPAQFRSLRADSESYELDVSVNSSLGEAPDAGTYSLNGSITRELSRSLSGLDIVSLTGPDGETAIRALDANPLVRYRTATTYSGGGSLNKPLGDWQFDATVDASHADFETLIDRRRDTSLLANLAAAGQLDIGGVLPTIASAGGDRAESRVSTVNSLATLRGNPVLLPGGEVNVTFDAGYSWNRIASEDSRADLGQTVLKRGDLSAGVNLGVPIASAREGFLSPLGELNLNLAAGINQLSDFGTLTDYTTGLSWNPTERLGLQASYIYREAAPGLSQLGDPVISDFNVPVFDFTRGESVLATIISGGNPNLLAETQRDFKISANYELDLFDRANILVEYFDNNSENVTEGFRLLTPQIEAAFPGRVTRAPDGTLLTIDRRPVTFAERNASRLRYGFNVFGRVGREETSERSDQAGGRGGGGGRFGGGRGGDGQGRWNMSLYHSVEFENEALVAQDGPLLDLLDGGALGSGGIPRHRIELEGGVFHQGIGLRLSGNYASATSVEGSGLPGSSDLFFGDLATFDARLFVNLEEQEWLTGGEPGIFEGTRLSLRANNLLDAQQRVTDETGAVPLSYQPGLIDPLGRFVQVEFRKIF